MRRFVAILACASCTLPALDLTDRACPCAGGYTCDEPTRHCVSIDSLSGRTDAGDDGRVERDSGPGGADAASDAPGPFCDSLSPTPTFCSDFDTLDLPAGWTMANSWGGGQIFADNAASQSAPRSVYFDVPALTGTAQAGASLLYQFAAPIQGGLDVDFDLLIEAMDSTSENFIAKVELFDTGAARDSILLGVREGRTRIVEEAYPADGGAPLYAGGDLSQPLTSGGWLHVTWKLARTGTSSTSNISITGLADAGASTNFSNLAMYQYSGPPLLTVGIPSTTPPNGHWRVRIDNVAAYLR